MTNKVINLKEYRKQKRAKTGWTMEEILQRAREERAAYKKLAMKEPDNLASGGDMNKILEQNDEDDEKE